MMILAAIVLVSMVSGMNIASACARSDVSCRLAEQRERMAKMNEDIKKDIQATRDFSNAGSDKETNEKVQKMLDALQKMMDD